MPTGDPAYLTYKPRSPNTVTSNFLSGLNGLITPRTSQEVPQAYLPDVYKDQRTITGRRIHKTHKETSQVVWPPLVEDALLKGLRAYKAPPEPAHRKPGAALRWPYRNRFISEWIKKQTGVTRTPKQVGSRLQQMRDTCKDDRIRELILPRRGFASGSITRTVTVDIDLSSGSPESSIIDIPSSSSTASGGIPAKDSTVLTGPEVIPSNTSTTRCSGGPGRVREVFVTVNLCMNNSGVAFNTVPLAGFSVGEPLRSEISLFPVTSSAANSPPTTLGQFDNTVHFWSPISAAKQRTVFSLFKDSTFLNDDSGFMYAMPTTQSNSAWSYSSLLCPKMWQRISRDPEVERLTIYQTVYLTDDQPDIRICYRFATPFTDTLASRTYQAIPPTLRPLEFDGEYDLATASPVPHISYTSHALSSAASAHPLLNTVFDSEYNVPLTGGVASQRQQPPTGIIEPGQAQDQYTGRRTLDVTSSETFGTLAHPDHTQYSAMYYYENPFYPSPSEY
ncbi:hypothetical protein CYLTODRAFT_445541 [Cylindrobasidium torrendii FP15055 ss-10]|uniref:TEA domain-containing protein n=1 Tax=Cylindrobasidium torrendii FP15055 ss-10 TaxID=1314674 RepID=A0A0D7B6K4_9AGAR|nr:hypothetical protein CYLTODRAFT_445541 [Cylindrobasidium torrendii FP15055 ss-10]